MPFPLFADCGLSELRAASFHRCRTCRTWENWCQRFLPPFDVRFLQRQFIRFNYSYAKGRNTHREVKSQAKLILPPLWYLVGWDPTR